MRKKKIIIPIAVLFLFIMVSNLNPSFLSNQIFFVKFNPNHFKLIVNSWLQNGNPVCTDPSIQSSIHLITNNNGFALIIWKDQRNATDGGDIYGQLIDFNGANHWETNGRPLINADGEQDPNGLMYAALNCAIFVWEDKRNGNYDIYTQKINLTNGNALWPSNGTIICNAVNDQKNPMLVSDGNGGAIITWIDERDGGTSLYIQRINSSGSTQWGSNGTLICNKTSSKMFSAQIITDGLNGSIVAWLDNRTGNNSIYCQRINSTGKVQWMDNGTPILNLENLTISNLQICEDGLNGSIISWSDNRSGNQFKIHAQRINSTGIIQWLANGTPICNKTTGHQQEGVMITDGEQGAIIVWKDDREITRSDLFSQKINSTGNNQWNENGSAVCKAIANQYDPYLIGDGKGGGIFSWLDGRSSNIRIYAQRINQTGVVNWTDDGVLICDSNALLSPIIAFDNNTGIYIAWIDKRNDGLGDIYIQRILPDGSMLYTVQPQLILFFLEPLKAFYEQAWFYALIALVVIDCLILYKIIKKKDEEEKNIVRKK